MSIRPYYLYCSLMCGMSALYGQPRQVLLGYVRKLAKHGPVSELQRESTSSVPHGGTLMGSASSSCLSSCPRWWILTWEHKPNKPSSSQHALAQRDFIIVTQRNLEQCLFLIGVKYTGPFSNRMQLEFVKYLHIHIELGAKHPCAASYFKCSFRQFPIRPNPRTHLAVWLWWCVQVILPQQASAWTQGCQVSLHVGGCLDNLIFLIT